MGHQKNRTGVYSGTVRYYRVPGRAEVREQDIIYIAGVRVGGTVHVETNSTAYTPAGCSPRSNEWPAPGLG